MGAGSVVDDVANAQTVVTLTGNSSVGFDGSGYSNITGRIHDTSNPKVDGLYYNINLAPSGVNTAVTALTIPTQSNKTYTIRGIVAIANTAASAYGEFEINAFATNASGTVVLQSNTTTQKANSSAFVVALSVSGTNLIVQFTDPSGATLNRRATGQVYVAERSF